MYGYKTKSDQEKKADQNFIDFCTKSGQTRKEFSKRLIDKGWKYYERKILDTAMFRFNQAWLLDSGNVDSYIGFSVIYGVLGKKKTEMDMLNKAIAFDGKNTEKIIMQVMQKVTTFNSPEKLSVSSDGIQKEYFKSGKLRGVGKYKDGKKIGEWTEYYETGEIHRVYNVNKNGYEDGKIINYFENGNKCIEFTKRNGNIVGEFKVYDYDGKLVRIEHWKHSKMSSSDTEVFKDWEIDGKPAWEMKDGKLIELVWKGGKKINKE